MLQTLKIMRSPSHLYLILRLNTHDFKMWRHIFFYTSLYCWLSLVFFHVQLTSSLFSVYVTQLWPIFNHNLLCSKLSSHLALRLVWSVWLCRTSAIVVSVCRWCFISCSSYNVECCQGVYSWPYAIFHVHQWHRLPNYFIPCPSLCWRRPNLHDLWATSHRKTVYATWIWTSTVYTSMVYLELSGHKPGKIPSITG
jgi:hypothetical protein